MPKMLKLRTPHREDDADDARKGLARSTFKVALPFWGPKTVLLVLCSDTLTPHAVDKREVAWR